MTAFAELDIVARTEGLVKAKADLDGLTKSAMATGDAAEDAGLAVTRASGRMAGAGGNSRMFAQQLSQVAQQGAATGQWAQAFAIQAADIGLAFGTVGTVVGMVATVALPTLISALSGTSGSANAARDAVDGLDDAVSGYVEASIAANLSTAELTDRYGELANQARIALQAMADVALVDALTQVDSAVKAVTDSLLEWQAVSVSGGRGAGSALALADDFGMAASAARDLQSGLLALRNSEGLEAQARAALNVQQSLIGVYKSVEAMPAPLRAAYAQMATIVVKAGEANAVSGKIPGILNSARDAANAAANAVAGIGSAAASATGLVQGLAQSMWDAAQARISANNALASMAIEFSPGGQALMKYGGRGTVDNRPVTMGDGILPPGNGGGGGGGGGAGGGGGGGGDDGFQSKLDALTEQFETEREMADAWYAESKAVLSDRRSMDQLGAVEHNELLLSIEQEYQARLAEIKANGHATERQMMNETLDATMGLLQQFGAKSKGLAIAGVALNAARRVAEIRANTAAAVMRAYAELGPVAGAAAAAKIKVMGAVQTGVALASAVMSAGSSGGGGGGGGGISSGREATAEPAQQQRIVRLDVQGEGMFADMLRQSGQAIVDAITNEQKFGGTTILMGRA